MSTTIYEKPSPPGSRLSVVRFSGGKKKGTICQLSIGIFFTILGKDEIKDVIDALQSILDYRKETGQDD